MVARSHLCLPLLLGLAGCPQFENDDWVVVDDASFPPESGDAAPLGDSASRAVDASAADVAASGTDAAAAGDASSSGGDAAGSSESGVPDSSVLDASIAVPLYCGLTQPLGITLFDTNVCWVGNVNPRGLFCAPTAGGGTPVHIDIASDEALLANAFDLLFDATNVYWSNGENNQVVVRSQVGGQAQEYFSGGGRVSFLSFQSPGDSSSIWATDYDPSGGSLGEVIVGPNPGGTSSSAIYNGQPGAAGVAVYNGTNVYWGTPSGIAFGPLTGGANMSTIACASPQPVAGVAVDGEGVVYFLAGSSLYRYEIGAASAMVVYQETQDPGAGDVAVDAQYVYFSEPALNCIIRVTR
jgi:hypothetical protein